MTLKILSEKSGVSKAMLSKIESAKVNPTISTVWKIATGLDVDINELTSLDAIEDIEFFLITVERGKKLISEPPFYGD